MNTKKYISLLSIIAFLSITLILIMVFKDKGYKLPKLSKINSEITQIEISRGEEGIIVIKKENSEWIINEKYKADNNTLSQMIKALTKSEISDIISRGDENSILKYELNNSNTLTVKAINSQGKEVRNFSLGTKATLPYQTYGQIKKDKNVYLLTSDVNLRDLFETTEYNLRNKVLFNINSVDITKLIIAKPKDLTFSLTRMTNKESEITNIQTVPYYYEAEYTDSNKKEIAADKAFGQLSALSSINANGFLDENFPETEVNLDIHINYNETNSVSYTISYPIDGKYEVRLDRDPVRYYLDENKVNRIINSITALRKQ